MKIDCEVIMDLLPLYVENIASQKSREIVEEHIAECKNCREIMNSMEKNEPELVHSAEPIKRLKKALRRHTIVTAIAIVLVVLVSDLILILGLNTEPGNEMGFVILFLYLILPATSFVCSLVAGTQKSKIKWGVPFICGALGILVPVIIFKSFDIIALFMGLIPSILGLIIGLLGSFVVRKIKGA